LIVGRSGILLLGFLMSVVTYLDRVCISAAAPAMTRDLGLTQMQMGYVFSAFGLAYALFEIPAGWWGDRIGQRRVLTRIVAGWSVFTMLTGLAWNYPLLLLTRFAFGAAEAGAYPNLSRALSKWFGPERRGFANGVMWTGARLGGAVAPALAALLIARIGWRLTFIVFGSVGLFWCAAFWRRYREGPLATRAHGPAPWGRIFTSPTLWKLFAMYFCSAYGFFFFVTWLPTFLIKEHGLTLERSGFYSSLPLAFGAAGCLAGGSLCDWLIRRTGNIKWSRRAIGAGGFLLAAAGFGAASLARDPLTATLCLALASGIHDMTVPVAWATVVEVGGPYGGSTSGFMNMASSFSGMLSATSAAWLAVTFGTFQVMLAAAAVTYFVGALLWLSIDPTRRLDM
jgi:MFS family permease